MKWIASFKYALKMRDTSTINNLVENIPEFNKIEDMRMAYACIDEVKHTLQERQAQLQQQMNRLH